MKYTGKLYGKIGGQYIQLEQDTYYVDGLEEENAALRTLINSALELWEREFSSNGVPPTVSEWKNWIDEAIIKLKK